MNLTARNGFDLCLGSGLYRFRPSVHGRNFLIRVPLLGKAWSHPGGHMGWAGVKEEHALGLGN